MEQRPGARPCTLLYLDPDPGTRLLVRRVLEPEGITVLEAETPFEAQRSADRAHPDVVLVDVDRVDAADLIPMRLALPSVQGAVWLASTAHPWPEDRGHILASGFERVLLKPLDIDTLAEDVGCEPRPRPASFTPLDDRPRHGPETNGVAAGERLSIVPKLPLEPELRHVPPLWQLTLAPVTASFVRSIRATHGLLVLLDEKERALVLTAAYSIRPVDRAPALGTTIPVDALGWLKPALAARQATVVTAATIVPSVFVPAGSTTVLLVPVATADRICGVAILGEQRSSRAGAFAPAAVSQSVGEARQIALVVESLRQLDRAMDEKRTELVGPRLDLMHALLTDLSARPRRSRTKIPARQRSRRRLQDPGGRESFVRLALGVAEALELPPREREVLRQALHAEDVGRQWLERMLFARTTLATSVRDALLDAYATHSAEILSGLDWPAPVVELVRTHRARWDGEGGVAPRGKDIPLAARILAAAHAAEGAGDDGIAELARHSGSRLDPDVVAAFIQRLTRP